MMRFNVQWTLSSQEKISNLSDQQIVQVALMTRFVLEPNSEKLIIKKE